MHTTHTSKNIRAPATSDDAGTVDLCTQTKESINRDSGTSSQNNKRQKLATTLSTPSLAGERLLETAISEFNKKSADFPSVKYAAASVARFLEPNIILQVDRPDALSELKCLNDNHKAQVAIVMLSLLECDLTI